MAKSRSKSLLDKSIAAMISAIEIYNKPDFSYREETFSVLAINSWELLLKARILQLSRNRLSSILVFERRKNQDGTISIKQYKKLNRAGNPTSVSLFKAIDLLASEYGDKLNILVKKNVEALVEIRDNSIHFMNDDFRLSKKVLEIGTANLKNYVKLVNVWFGDELSRYNFYLMPISFFTDMKTAELMSLNGQEKKLLEYVNELESENRGDESSSFNLALELEIKFKRVSDIGTTEVKVTNDPSAIAVQLQEEDIREKFPWDYSNLTARLNKRYRNFKLNSEYHKIRKKLSKNKKFCLERYLDPGNPSSKKMFFNPNIIREFDNYYKRS